MHMNETIGEIGKCERCKIDINLGESWRVDEKFYCQDCFDKLNI